MDVTISIEPEIFPQVQQAASAKGQDIASFLSELLKEVFTNPVARRAPTRTLDEILAPFRAQVEASGITDEELDSFFEDLREKRFRELQDQRG